MKINWKVRIKNKVWLASFIALVVSFVYTLLDMLGVVPEFTQDYVMTIVNQVLTLLGLFGVIIDPTTAGMSDSNRAMNYDEPWDDDMYHTDFPDSNG